MCSRAPGYFEGTAGTLQISISEIALALDNLFT